MFLGVGFVAGLAEAAAALQVPIAVAFAKIFGRRILDGVGNTDAVRLLDGGQLAAGGRGWERGERGSHLRTGDVVDADGQERDAGALVAECEIDTFLRHRDGTDLRVDDHLRSPKSSSLDLDADTQQFSLLFKSSTNFIIAVNYQCVDRTLTLG